MADDENSDPAGGPVPGGGENDEGNDHNESNGDSSPPPPLTATTVNGMDELIELIRRQSIREKQQAAAQRAQQSGSGGGGGGAGGQSSSSSSSSANADTSGNIPGRQHAFWDTQPMPHERMAALESAASGGGGSSSRGSAARASSGMNGNAAHDGQQQHCPIVPDKPQSELRQTPYNMPKGFEWSILDVVGDDDSSSSTANRDKEEIYELLSKNYVEDDDCMFRFDYSPEFLTWALTPPGFSRDFHLGVRSTKSGRLMAFISGVPATVRVFNKEVKLVEINFLCVHKKLRSKRLAPVLIKEITRRVNMTGVFQAVYTAGLVLPVPVATCRYYHRSLDPKKLIEVGFSRLGPRMTMARIQKLYKLPSETTTPGLRPMTPEDVPGAHKLLTNYLKKFQLTPLMTLEEFSHWLLPREGVVNSFVAVNDGGEVTDLCTYYHLPSTVIGNSKHSKLRAAYSFYNVATAVDIKDLMRDCLILAKRDGQDVFNALNVMENDEFLQELKFGIGDGRLQYYLYNWSCPSMEAKDIGLVLL